MAQTTASNDLSGLFGLKGRNYVITGGAQGIGFAVGKAVAQVGGNIVAMDIQDKPKPEFMELSSKFGVKAIYIQTDVTHEASLKAAFEQAVDALGSIHGCVTCAGIAMEKPFEEHTWEEVRRVMDINVSRGLAYVFLLIHYRACHLARLQAELFSRLPHLDAHCLTTPSRCSEPTSRHNSQLSR